LKKTKTMFVSTAIIDTWGDNENIFFLGEWCKKYNERHLWSDRNTTTAQWHWSNRNKVRTDFYYIRDLCEKIFIELAHELNHVHQVDHSLRYWRIILFPWLTTYIAVMFDRWESIKFFGSLAIDCKTIIPSQNISIPVAQDYNDAISLMANNDLWNYLIYCEILKTQNLSGMELTKRNIYLDLYNQRAKRQSSWIASAAISLDRLTYKLLKVRSYDFVIYKSYFQCKFLLKLFYKLKQFPRLHSEFEKEIEKNKDGHFFKRPTLNIKEDLSHFECFLYDRLFQDMPSAYLEDFEILYSYCESLPDASVIFTANAHFHNEKFKIWSAQQVSKGSKLIISEHGNSIVPDLADLGAHEDNICDIKTVWHKELEEKQIKLPPNKLIEKRLNFVNNGKLVTMIGLEFPRFSYRCQSGPNSSLILDDFSQKVSFINLLDEKILKNFQVRPYPNRGWFTKDRYSDIFGKDILTKNATIDQDFIESKLVICTYPQTTFSEAMHTGIPTILLYIEDYWELHPAFDELMVKLKEVGIAHSDPVKAAEHVNFIGHNPEAWWNEEKTLLARKMFHEICGTVSDSPLDDWINFFEKFKASGEV